MQIISQQQIRALNISPATCVDWIKESFAIKKVADLPAKISVHPEDGEYDAKTGELLALIDTD